MSVDGHARACIVAAPSSGQGKTWITAALARKWARAGQRVRVFKTGPDFIDPEILTRASGGAVHTLDLWMAGDEQCAQQLSEAARNSDVVLVEGVMGLFDGTPSTADLAQRFGLAVLLVVDASAMAQTFGAVVHGLMDYRPELRFAGVVANRVAGAGHAEMLLGSLRDRTAWHGAIGNDATTTLPERDLGLVMPSEIDDLDAKLERAADSVVSIDLDRFPRLELPELAPAKLTATLRGVRIAVARDAAFCFAYPANLELLRTLGAELRFFSPCDDREIPEADALYLPGGYPELHVQALAQNTSMRTALRAHIAANKPTLAECGGLMWLARGLRTRDGVRHEMAGVLDLEVEMQAKLVSIGHYECAFDEGSLRGHAYHYSQARGGAFVAESATSPHGGRAEPVYRQRRLVASYVHWYLPSNPALATQLFTP
ncbi:MAG TPA: cobyrinate a,c-diamide synthase [Polyangiales bacterium]